MMCSLFSLRFATLTIDVLLASNSAAPDLDGVLRRVMLLCACAESPARETGNKKDLRGILHLYEDALASPPLSCGNMIELLLSVTILQYTLVLQIGQG
jgi:hypothetical protein